MKTITTNRKNIKIPNCYLSKNSLQCTLQGKENMWLLLFILLSASWEVKQPNIFHVVGNVILDRFLDGVVDVVVGILKTAQQITSWLDGRNLHSFLDKKHSPPSHMKDFLCFFLPAVIVCNMTTQDEESVAVADFTVSAKHDKHGW